LLSSVGAVLAVFVANWGSRLIVAQLSTQTNTVFLDLAINWRVLAFTAGVTIATALLFGTAPAWRTSGVEPMDAIREHGPTAARGSAGARVFRGRFSLAGALVVAQVALSVVLLVAAGLFVRTFTRLASRDLGFRRDGLLLVSINTQRSSIDPARRLPVLAHALQAVRAGPAAAAPVRP